MKKVLFSVIALTALGMTQAHAETHNKTAEFSVTTKAFAADAGFMGLAGARGSALSNGAGGGAVGGSTNRIGSTLSSGDKYNIGKDKGLNSSQTKLGDLRTNDNDKGRDRNRCSGCGGGGNTNDNRLFDRDFNQR